MKKVLTLTILCALIATFALADPAVLFAGQKYLPVKGTCNTWLTGPMTADGFGTVTIGTETHVVYIHVDLDIMVNKGKSIHATATHTYRTGPNIDDPVLFVTNDSEVLAPTGTDGVYILNGHSQVAEGGNGHLAFHGTLDFNTYQVSYEIHGAMCLAE